MKKEKLTICAIVAVRNENQYLKVLLPHLAQQDIDVVIIDNESTDDSQQLYSKFSGKPVIHVESLPYRGFFSLSAQLSIKKQLYDSLKHDWIVHHDADEILEHCKPEMTLRDAIREADTGGFNAINFEEFVFIPEPGTDYNCRNYYTDLLRYYFFEPKKNRLNRAWKRTAQFSNHLSGGHTLVGDNLIVAPENHILRHYMILSQDHAKEKYLNRCFDILDIVGGWHKKRLRIYENNMLLPDLSDSIFHLKDHSSKDFCKSNPVSNHFWMW